MCKSINRVNSIYHRQKCSESDFTFSHGEMPKFISVQSDKIIILFMLRFESLEVKCGKNFTNIMHS
jgi:hypothetical protein